MSGAFDWLVGEKFQNIANQDPARACLLVLVVRGQVIHNIETTAVGYVRTSSPHTSERCDATIRSYE